MKIKIIIHRGICIRGQIRMGILESIIDNPNVNASAAERTPNIGHMNVDARSGSILPRVAQVPLLRKERVIGQRLLLGQPGQLRFGGNNAGLAAQLFGQGEGAGTLGSGE